LNDVTARVFEIMAMRLCPVLNRLPGLDYMGFVEDKHYLGFSSMDEAVEKVLWVKNHREYADKIAQIAYGFVHERNMTWDSRVDQILKTVGLLDE
jgi:spore maturation protein CgeB